VLTKDVATVGGASKGSLVTLLCGLTGTKDTPTFNPPMTKRAYSDSTPFSSVVARHRLMDAAMKIRAKLLIPLDRAYFHPWWRSLRFMMTNY
jgi:hypothetical protein